MKTKTKNKNQDSLIYILLLSSFIILFNAIQTYNIDIYNITISSSYLLLPIIFYIQNIMFNKFSTINNIFSILVSMFLSLIFIYTMDFILEKTLIIEELPLEIIILMITSYINLLCFKTIRNRINEPYILILANYLLVNIIYHLVNIIFTIDNIVFKYYFKEYFLILFIQLLIIIIISAIDKETIIKKKS